jgi:hypothetical protein
VVQPVIQRHIYGSKYFKKEGKNQHVSCVGYHLTQENTRKIPGITGKLSENTLNTENTGKTLNTGKHLLTKHKVLEITPKTLIAEKHT